MKCKPVRCFFDTDFIHNFSKQNKNQEDPNTILFICAFFIPPLASKLASGPGIKNAPLSGALLILFAERKGFEPLIPFRVYTLSRRAPSTTRTPLLVYPAQPHRASRHRTSPIDGLARGLQKYNFPAYLPNIFCAFSVVIRATSSTETPFTSASFAAIYFR